MYKYLIQKQWFRNILSKRTFYRNYGEWYDLVYFEKGEIIHGIDGKWNTQCYCECGNELVHSQSFLDERYVKETEQYVFDYKCSFCGVEQHYNPDMIPGLLRCDKNGIPFSVRKGVISYKVPKGLKLSDITMSEENKQQNMEAVQYDTVLSNVDLQNNLKEIGFKSIGSGWYENEEHLIRLRLWKDCEIDFWLHRSSVDEDDNELRFRGKIYKFDDVRWVLNRCFGYIA